MVVTENRIYLPDDTKEGGDAQETITSSTHSTRHFKWKKENSQSGKQFWKRFYGKCALGKYSKRFSNHFTYIIFSSWISLPLISYQSINGIVVDDYNGVDGVANTDDDRYTFRW